MLLDDCHSDSWNDSMKVSFNDAFIIIFLLSARFNSVRSTTEHDFVYQAAANHPLPLSEEQWTIVNCPVCAMNAASDVDDDVGGGYTTNKQIHNHPYCFNPLLTTLHMYIICIIISHELLFSFFRFHLPPPSRTFRLQFLLHIMFNRIWMAAIRRGII